MKKLSKKITGYINREKSEIPNTEFLKESQDSNGKIVLKVENLVRNFKMGKFTVKALDNVSFEIQKGEFVSIMGKSGSGKTTLLNILGTLDTPTSGEVFID